MEFSLSLLPVRKGAFVLNPVPELPKPRRRSVDGKAFPLFNQVIDTLQLFFVSLLPKNIATWFFELPKFFAHSNFRLL